MTIGPSDGFPALGDAYAVERELGGGGMSRVFVATEVALKRRVVVKLLSRELAEGLSAERFAREIALAAALQDPHIVPVLATGITADGLPYFTMPFVEGESLRARLQRGPLPLDEALRILRDVAEALEHAHARGIVHRDIKPENILLSGRNAVVADFGIAKAVSAARTMAPNATLTSAGMALGTPGYMAPEQVAGEPTDARSDLYAWGVVAYELLAGGHPFAHRTSAQQLMAAQIAEAPRPLDDVRPGLPQSIAVAVMRCLEKDATERPASAAVLLATLSGISSGDPGSGPRDGGPRTPARSNGVVTGEVSPAPRGLRRRMPIAAGLVVLLGFGAWVLRGKASGAAPAEAQEHAIAVLPFEHQGDSADTYLTDGITDEIRHKLTGVTNLVVIARASSNQYKGKNTPPQEIAKELGVRYLLTGSVRLIGSGDQRRVLVRPELVEVTANGRLQSRGGQPFDAPVSEVIRAQGEVAEQVVNSMEVAVAGADRLRLVEVPTRNPQAYDAYLRGLAAINGEASNDPESLLRGNELFEQAVARDSTFVEAWGYLARGNALLYSNATPSPERAGRAREAVARLNAVAPGSADALRSRSVVRRAVDHDYAGALDDLRRARAVAPGDASVLGSLAGVEADLGRFDEALRTYDDAQRLDPRTPAVSSGRTRLLTRMRRFADARIAGDRARSLAPASRAYVHNRIIIEVAAGDLAAARRVYEAATAELPKDRLLAYVAMYWDLWWVPSELDQQRLLELGSDAYGGDFTAAMPLVRAQVHAALGHEALARVWADSAVVALRKRVRGSPSDGESRVVLGLMLAYAGNAAEAMREAERGLALADAITSARMSNANGYAYVFAARTALKAGDRARALTWLREGLGRRPNISAAWVRIDPNFAPLRGDPAFERVLAEAP